MLQITSQYKKLNGSVKEPNKFHNYETEKITRRASDAAEYIVVWLFRPRSSCTTHLMLFSERHWYMRHRAGRSRVEEPNIRTT